MKFHPQTRSHAPSRQPSRISFSSGRFHAVRQKFATGFWILAIVAALVWGVGVIAGAVIPIFGGIRAETIGGIMLSVVLSAEGLMYLFGWLYQKTK
jgi:hypothetical protein